MMDDPMTPGDDQGTEDGGTMPGGDDAGMPGGDGGATDPGMPA